MALTYGRDERPPEDLTARARIRDAALVAFAERGYEGATMKAIADAAGVSVGLVQHHFGTKDGLRRACDEAVIGLLRRKLDAAVADRLANPEVLAALAEAGPRMVAYLARAFVDGSPAGAEVFDQLVGSVEEFLTARWPDRFAAGTARTRAAAAAIGALSGGVVVMHPHLARRLELEPWEDLSSPTASVALLDAYLAMGEYVASVVGDDPDAFIGQVFGDTPAQPGKEEDDG